MAVIRVGVCRDRVLYNDVQNVVVMNTSAFYLSESLMCVADLHAVCFLKCGIKIYDNMQSSLRICVLSYMFLVLIHESDVKDYNPEKYLVYSLYKDKKQMCPSCKINMYVCSFFICF